MARVRVRVFVVVCGIQVKKYGKLRNDKGTLTLTKREKKKKTGVRAKKKKKK